MDKLQLLEKLSLLLTNFVVSVISSAVRMMFHPADKFWVTVMNFCGGIAFGTLIGYLSSDIKLLSGYHNLLAAAAALVGKEIVDTLISITPKVVKWLTELRIKSIK